MFEGEGKRKTRGAVRQVEGVRVVLSYKGDRATEMCVCACLRVLWLVAAQVARALHMYAERYFLFKGSLTVPPCTEDVTWYVLKDQLAIDPEDLAYAKKIQGHNARPVQPFNDRATFDIN